MGPSGQVIPIVEDDQGEGWKDPFDAVYYEEEKERVSKQQRRQWRKLEKGRK